MITCDDIEGTCCNSCHEDYQLGYEDGGYDEMCAVYAPGSDTMFAHVCCRKVDEANALMEKEVLANAQRRPCDTEGLQNVHAAPPQDDTGA